MAKGSAGGSNSGLGETVSCPRALQKKFLRNREIRMMKVSQGSTSAPSLKKNFSKEKGWRIHRVVVWLTSLTPNTDYY